MVDMSKMKEEALRRKREHEEKELRKQMSSSKRRASSRASSRGGRSSARGGARENPSAQRALAQRQGAQPRKKKRSVSRWVLDILLVLGALLVLVIILSPFR